MLLLCCAVREFRVLYPDFSLLVPPALIISRIEASRSSSTTAGLNRLMLFYPRLFVPVLRLLHLHAMGFESRGKDTNAKKEENVSGWAAGISDEITRKRVHILFRCGCMSTIHALCFPSISSLGSVSSKTIVFQGEIGLKTSEKRMQKIDCVDKKQHTAKHTHT